MEITWPLADPDRVVVAGDWHGNDRAARNALIAATTIQAPVVIQLGDFGLWPGFEGEAYLDLVDAHAQKAGVPVAWIDGNHEDFTQLEAMPVEAATGMRRVRENIWHLPRGTGWTWHGVRFIALGGATSVDRPQRVPGKSWWPQESITGVDLDAALSWGTCDVLLTHDCPTGTNIPGIAHRNYAAAFASGWPVPELERAWDHRDVLAGAVRELGPRHLWHGHFHVRYSDQVAFHPDVTTHVEGLADDGSGPACNLMVAELDHGWVTTRPLSDYLDTST